MGYRVACFFNGEFESDKTHLRIDNAINDYRKAVYDAIRAMSWVDTMAGRAAYDRSEEQIEDILEDRSESRRIKRRRLRIGNYWVSFTQETHNSINPAEENYLDR